MIYDTKDILQNVPSLMCKHLTISMYPISQTLQLMEWLEIKSIEYLDNGAFLFHEIKIFFN